MFYIYIFIHPCSFWENWFLLTQLSLPFSFQATEQMEKQLKKSSSIIVALTDGKLDTYIYQLTKDAVSWCLKSYIFYLM